MSAKVLGPLCFVGSCAALCAVQLYGCCNPVTQTGLTQSMIANPAPTGRGGASVAYHGTLAEAKTADDIGGSAVSRHHLVAAADRQLGRWFRLQGIYRAGLRRGATERPGWSAGPELPDQATHLVLLGGELQFLHREEPVDFGVRAHVGPSATRVARSGGLETETTVTPAFDVGLFVRMRPTEKVTLDFAGGFMSYAWVPDVTCGDATTHVGYGGMLSVQLAVQISEHLEWVTQISGPTTVGEPMTFMPAIGTGIRIVAGDLLR